MFILAPKAKNCLVEKYFKLQIVDFFFDFTLNIMIVGARFCLPAGSPTPSLPTY